MYEIKQLFPVHLRDGLKKEDWQEELEEIRVRIGQPIEFFYGKESRFLEKEGKQIRLCVERNEKGASDLYRASMQDMQEMMNTAGCVSRVRDIGLPGEVIEESLLLAPYTRRRLSLLRLRKLLIY